MGRRMKPPKLIAPPQANVNQPPTMGARDVLGGTGWTHAPTLHAWSFGRNPRGSCGTIGWSDQLGPGLRLPRKGANKAL